MELLLFFLIFKKFIKFSVTLTSLRLFRPSTHTCTQGSLLLIMFPLISSPRKLLPCNIEIKSTDFFGLESSPNFCYSCYMNFGKCVNLSLSHFLFCKMKKTIVLAQDCWEVEILK